MLRKGCNYYTSMSRTKIRQLMPNVAEINKFVPAVLNHCLDTDIDNGTEQR